MRFAFPEHRLRSVLVEVASAAMRRRFTERPQREAFRKIFSRTHNDEPHVPKNAVKPLQYRAETQRRARKHPPVKILALCERAGIAGGMETYVRTLQDALSSRGIEQRILTRADLQWSDEHDAGSPAAAAQLRSLCAQLRPDVIALHNVLDAQVLTAARECAPNMTYHLHDHRLFCPNGDRVYPQGGGRCTVRMGAACAAHSLVHGCVYGPRRRTLRLISLRTNAARAAMRSDSIVAMSAFMSSLAQHNGVGHDCMHLIRPPLHAAFFEPHNEPDFVRPRVLFSGRAVPAKGLRSLIRAACTIAADRRPIVAVAGDGPELDACVQLARERGCEIELYGKLDRAGVIAAIDRSMMIAMPSLWNEPFGLSGIEAFARGRPVAAYQSGAIGEWIGEGGIAVGIGDERALGNAIVSLLERPAWARYATRAAALSTQYNAEQHVDALLRAYDATAQSRPVPPAKAAGQCENNG